MAVDLEIVFRGMESSEAVKEDILKRADRLQRHHNDVRRVRATIEQDHASHEQGNLFSVHLDVIVPGNDIYVSRNPGNSDEHEDVYVTIRDAFEAAERQLQKYDAKRRGR